MAEQIRSMGTSSSARARALDTARAAAAEGARPAGPPRAAPDRSPAGADPPAEPALRAPPRLHSVALAGAAGAGGAPVRLAVEPPARDADAQCDLPFDPTGVEAYAAARSAAASRGGRPVASATRGWSEVEGRGLVAVISRATSPFRGDVVRRHLQHFDSQLEESLRRELAAPAPTAGPAAAEAGAGAGAGVAAPQRPRPGARGPGSSPRGAAPADASLAAQIGNLAEAITAALTGAQSSQRREESQREQLLAWQRTVERRIHPAPAQTAQTAPSSAAMQLDKLLDHVEAMEREREEVLRRVREPARGARGKENLGGARKGGEKAHRHIEMAPRVPLELLESAAGRRLSAAAGRGASHKAFEEPPLPAPPPPERAEGAAWAPEVARCAAFAVPKYRVLAEDRGRVMGVAAERARRGGGAVDVSLAAPRRRSCRRDAEVYAAQRRRAEADLDGSGLRQWQMVETLAEDAYRRHVRAGVEELDAVLGDVAEGMVAEV